MHPEERDVEECLGHEVAVGHRVERVLEAPVETQFRRDEVGVERQRRAGQGARAERRRVEPVHRGEQAVDVAGQRPAVGQEVVGQEHGLGPLHVGVTGEVDVGGVDGALGQRVLERHDLEGHADQGAAAPQAQRGGHLVVAAPPGVQLGAHVADQLGHAPLNRSVDVLVARGEGEHAAVELLFDHVERVDAARRPRRRRGCRPCRGP